MITQQLYDTFTNPRVVTSMMLVAIGLGLILSAMLKYLNQEWYMPTLFVALCLVTALGYMYWLDHQDWRDV
jgi:hydrogenase/urease accessory protein HupE